MDNDERAGGCGPNSVCEYCHAQLATTVFLSSVGLKAVCPDCHKFWNGSKIKITIINRKECDDVDVHKMLKNGPTNKRDEAGKQCSSLMQRLPRNDASR